MNVPQFKLLLVIQIATLFLVGMSFLKNTPTQHIHNENHAAKQEMVKVNYGQNYVYGKPDAANELIIFSRYNCGFCRDFYNEAFDELYKVRIAPGRLKAIFIQDVNPSDKVELMMAKVAEISKQYNKYEEAQRLFYRDGGKLDSAGVMRHALTLGLSEQEVLAALTDESLTQKLMNNRSEMERLQINGTPTFVLNGLKNIGYRGFGEFVNFIDNGLLPIGNKK